MMDGSHRFTLTVNGQVFANKSGGKDSLGGKGLISPALLYLYMDLFPGGLKEAFLNQ